MKRLLLLCLSLCFGWSASYSQSLPSPFNLASGPYSFTTWDATNPAGTYPTSMIFHRYAITDGVLLSQEALNYSLAYNAPTGIKINGLGANGIEFVNSSAPQSVGTAVVALNTLNRMNVRLNFTAAFTAWNGSAPTPPVREWGLRLQYKVGAAGAWTDVLDGVGNPVEFLTTGRNPGSVQSYADVLLPTAAENQSAVYVRWKYYWLGVGGGSRPQVRLDDISITSTQFVVVPTQLAITGITPSTVSSTSTFNVTVQAQNAGGVSGNVTQNTDVAIALQSGTGTLTGTLTGTIPAGQNSVIITGVRYATIENNVQLRANVTAGMALTQGISAPFNVVQGATTVTATDLVNRCHLNKPLRPFTINATRPDATTDASYLGTVTIAQVSGPGTVTGTFSKSFVNGQASFNDLRFSQLGTYVISISGSNLTTITQTIQVYPALTMTEMFVPRFIKSRDANNRVPTFALVKLDNLMPNTQYRYITGAVTSSAPSATIGGGNNYHYDATTGTYLYSSNRTLASTASPATNSTFITGPNETSRMVWLNLVPTSNAAFTSGATTYWRVIMTDHAISGYQADTMHTASFTTPIDLGSGSTQATGIYDSQSGLAQRTYVLLYDNEAGTGRPISTAHVQDDGTSSDTVTFAQFFKNLDNVPTSWATIIPNNLPGGVKRIEHRDMQGNLVKFWSDADGVWAGVNTVFPIGGTTAIDFRTPQLTFITPSVNQVHCQGKPMNITWFARGVEKVHLEYASGYSTGRTYYEIRYNANATPSQFTWVPNDFKDSSTRMSIRITDFEHPTAQAEILPMTIFLPPVVQIHPKSRNTCVGDTVTLFATATGTSVQYQWFKDYKPLTGATSPVLAFVRIQGIESGLYHCRMTGLAPCDAVSTDTAVIYINRPIEVLKQPESKIVTKGSTVSFEVSANANYVITYQWKKNGFDVQNSMRISGAQSPTLVIRDIDLADIAQYTCIATGPGNCGSVTTQPVTLDVLSVAIVNAPEDVTACEGKVARFNVNAQSTPAGSTLSYQWFKDGVKINGATLEYLELPNVKNADQGTYTVEVSATGNVIGKAMAISAPATLTVKPNLAITAEPDAEKRECAGKTMSVSVTATGSNVRYQWYSNGAALTGETNASFSRIADTVTLPSEKEYFCIITSDCGTDTTIKVRFISLPAVTFVTTYPTEGVNVDFGTNFTFTANATGSNLTYKWYKDGVEINGANQASYTLINATRKDQNSKYKVEVTGDCGTIASKDINVTVIGPASIDDEATAWMLNSKPNPNNGDMTIQFAVTKPGLTSLFIRDAIGREIARFEAGMMDIGNYEHAFSLQNVSSGLYYVTMEQAGQTITRSMTIIK
ncbi:MAG: hypothetical protein FJ219_04135 [Ignavibacteria bacterium]|nr:hypothetical protein [Ignavibacteria bacterium]